MTHEARPVMQPDGTWAAYCPAEGRTIGSGPPLRYRELAEQLARSHRDIHNPPFADRFAYPS